MDAIIVHDNTFLIPRFPLVVIRKPDLSNSLFKISISPDLLSPLINKIDQNKNHLLIILLLKTIFIFIIIFRLTICQTRRNEFINRKKSRDYATKMPGHCDRA